MVGTLQDVTEWEQSRAALAESEALRAAVHDSALDGVIVIDGDGRVVEWNHAAERSFGYSREEAAGQELATLIVPERLRAPHRAGLRRVRGGGESSMLGRRIEQTAMRKGGAEFPVELAIVRVPGERELFAGYIRDMSDWEEAKGARQLAEEQWRTLVEQVPAVTYLAEFDDRASMLYMSPQVEDMVGIAAERMLESTDVWLECVHPDDRERFREEQRARFHEQRGFSCVYRMIGTDGEVVWVDERSTLMRDADGTPRHLQGVIYDVTARRIHEEELREAQRLESVGQLAGGIAHDFNNLLGVIQGYAELLEGDSSPEAREDIDEIRKAASRAADLTRQLLLFARREPVEAEIVDVNVVLGELADMLRRIIGEHVTVRIEPVAHPCVVAMASQHLEQVLVNLAVNARDAMPDGGTLTISTARRGGSVTLRVADDGAGMASDVAARAFDPFFTTKEKGRGTGLGLATVYGVIQAAGGHVSLTSRPGEGTTVAIELPECPALPAAAEMPDADRALDGAGETILVVEDEHGVRELTARMLAASGYEVLKAQDGESARGLMREHGAPVDLLLSDVVMPGMSGPEVARSLRAEQPDLRVLYMSGHAGDILDHHGLTAQGARGIIAKPFERRQLLARVRGALREVEDEAEHGVQRD